MWLIFFCVLFFFLNVNLPSVSFIQNSSNKNIRTDLPKPKNEKLIDLDNFAFTINSPVCENEKEIPVITVINSAPDNFDQRQAIRDTWANPTGDLKHVFLLGETTEELFKTIFEEHQQYGDIVQGNFIDSYRNLTYKHVMGLKWANQYCPNAEFILKTDDDVFINIYQLKDLVRKRLSRENDSISCFVHDKLEIMRDVSSQWYVSKQEYAGTHYPATCSGT